MADHTAWTTGGHYKSGMVSPLFFHLIAKSWSKTKIEFDKICYFSEPIQNVLEIDSDDMDF
jgi:hypothetical protein